MSTKAKLIKTADLCKMLNLHRNNVNKQIMAWKLTRPGRIVDGAWVRHGNRTMIEMKPRLARQFIAWYRAKGKPAVCRNTSSKETT